jgi:DNA-directed RNA polymerase II subunit RPB1
MTHRGYIMSIDRHGINKSEAGPLARCSFEETTDQLAKAGVFSQIDDVVSLSSNIIVGKTPIFGTNMFDIII